MTDYAHPGTLVSCEWVLEHIVNSTSPAAKLVEVDVDTNAYDQSHIPGAVAFNWESQLQDQVRRDIVSKDDFAKLCAECGISSGDTVVLYGDNNNWFAAYAFWIFKLYGHEDVRLMNGGRVKWLADSNLPTTTEAPSVTAGSYSAKEADVSLRASVTEILSKMDQGLKLVDVRSPAEYSGEVIAPPGMTETAQRGGHIPGASSVPWASAVQEDGTFKSFVELKSIYLDGAGVDATEDCVAYCRIGERSSHTWFVLKYLLGVEHARNYDGSWTEYGSMVGVPIETGL